MDGWLNESDKGIRYGIPMDMQDNFNRSEEYYNLDYISLCTCLVPRM